MSRESAIIREFEPADYPAVIRIWEDTGMGGKQRGDDLEVIQRTIGAGGKLLLLTLQANGEIIGTCWLTVDGRRTYLHHFGISPAYQGKGYAKQLLRESFRWARSTGFQLKLEVHRDNIPAVSLYRNAGFKYLGDYDVYIIRDLNETL